jgi:hypothetical protein
LAAQLAKMFHVKHFCKVFGAATTQGLVGLCSGIEQILLIGRARGCPAADPRALAGEALRILATGA